MQDLHNIRFVGNSFLGADRIHFHVVEIRDGQESPLDTSTIFDEPGEMTQIAWGCNPDCHSCWALSFSLLRAIDWERTGEGLAASFSRLFTCGFKNNWELTGEQVLNMLFVVMEVEAGDESADSIVSETYQWELEMA